jgi:nicotinate dehydrogenase subunit A
VQAPAEQAGDREEITLEINGRRETIVVAADTSLLQVLRNDLRLTGAKLGCGLEQCFACAVIVDGTAVTTCASAATEFVGRRITTIEGVASGAVLHPVQEAFVAEEAAQCGYCIPGMIMGAVALLERNPDPSEAEIKEALAPHLCRCGSQPRILKAVRRAAGGMV